MSDLTAGLLQAGAVILVLAAAYVPLGDFMAAVYRSPRDLGAERTLYRLARIDPRAGQTWRVYASSVLGFSLASVLVLYALQRWQGLLPGNAGKPGISPTMALNTAISFVTNTNWQSYSAEATMGNLTQMLGLTVQNFLSAAVGMAVAVAFIRGLIARDGKGTIGNFWVDLVRGALRILLPLALLFALVLLVQGAVQSWHADAVYTLLDGRRASSPIGPFAGQEAIKVLGTNGGGTLAANSAHPYANPTPLTNIMQVVAMLLIPVSLTRTYSTLVGDRRQGLTLLGVMAAIWGAMLALVWYLQSRPTGIAAVAAGANLEGTEVRFGIPGTALFAVSTTGTSTGAVNAAHGSFAPGAGGALLWNMLLGEVAPGGVGSGLYSILILALITVFVGGLMVGRTPEFLGKKVSRREITAAVLYILVMPTLVLAGSSISLVLASTTGAMGGSGPPGSLSSIHGFTEVLYAYASAANNNGSAFGGLTATSDWFQLSLALAMFFGRFLPIVLILALAGMFVQQQPRDAHEAALPPAAVGHPGSADHLNGVVVSRSTVAVSTGSGTLPTHGFMFGGLLLGTTVLVAGLTFFPAMALGPIAEALS